MLAHVPSFGRNPRGSPDFLAYPVPKACMHALGTRVPRRLGVARSASSPKAALALGCSLTPGLRISFGRVTCMARAASVPGLWALGFLLLACVGGWVRVAVGRGFFFHLPVVAGVLGGCVWARFVVLSLLCRLFVVFVVGLWCRPAFGTCVVSCAIPLPPAVSGSGVRCGRACSAQVSSVPRPSWLGCRGVFFAFFFFRLLGVPVPGLVVSPPGSFPFGWAAGFFFFVGVCLFRCPFSRRAAVPGLVLRVFAWWSPCACLGVLSSVPSGWVVWPPSVFLAGGFVAVASLGTAPLSPPLFFFFGGGGATWLFLPLPSLGWRLLCGWCVVWLVPRHSWRRFLCATPRHSWLGFAAGGGGRSPPLLAGVRWRWWCVALVCWWGCGWCVVRLVPRHSWRRFLCATPSHSWLGFAAAGGGRSPPLLAGVRWRRCCVVCGVWRWCVGGVVAGVWCGWSLATPGGGSCVLLPATPGWVLLPAVVGGPRHSWLGSACGGGVWCVVCGVWCVAGCVGGVVAGVWCGWSLATPGRGSCVLLPATPGWVLPPAVVSPPLLAEVRLRWWCVVCGVWCVVCGGVCWWGCGWCVVWLVPRHSWRRSLCATPRHSWLGFAAAGGGRSPPLLAGVRWRRCGVVCGVWCVAVVCCWGCGWCVACGGGVLLGLWLLCGVVGPSPLLAVVPVCYSPPLLAGFRCRWWWAFPATPGWGPLAAVVRGVWCVVCGGGVLLGLVVGVWRVAVVCCWGCGWCVVWLVPRHSWRWSLCATPRHSWLGFAAGGGGRSPPLLAGVRWRRWCVVCGVWCVGGVPRHSWRRFLCATPRHSWLGFAAAGGGRSPPLLAGVRWRRWCVVCGVCCVAVVCCWGGGWCVVWLVPRHSWRRSLCATPRHSWLGFAAGGGGRSPPLLAGVRWRRWCVVCGVLVGSLATPGGGSCVLLPATPGWVSLPLVVGGPRHSWLGSVGGGGVWCVVCWWGPSPLLAEVPVCYSPPLLAGFRCRWWWAVPATPGWGPLAGVWCGVCSCACFAWPGRAGRPPGRVLVRLTFSFGRFVFLLCLAPSGPGLPLSLSLLLPFLVGCFSRPPAAWLSVRSRLVCVQVGRGNRRKGHSGGRSW